MPWFTCGKDCPAASQQAHNNVSMSSTQKAVMSRSAPAKHVAGHPAHGSCSDDACTTADTCSARATRAHRATLGRRQVAEHSAPGGVACQVQRQARAQVPQLRLLRQALQRALCWGGCSADDRAQLRRREGHQIHDRGPLRERDAACLLGDLPLQDQGQLSWHHERGSEQAVGAAGQVAGCVGRGACYELDRCTSSLAA